MSAHFGSPVRRHFGADGHTHEHMDNPGSYLGRDGIVDGRDFTKRAFTVGIGGPVGSGKTALTKVICEKLRESLSIAVVTNDIFTREDAEFLLKHEVLEPKRIKAVETGGCPHAAIREDISMNMHALNQFMDEFQGDIDLFVVESGGDNLAADYSRELADYTIYVIDVAGGDKVPRKGGPGITQSDLLVINKTDIAEYVGSSLEVMARDSKQMREDGPFIFTQAVNGVGIDEVIEHMLHARSHALAGEDHHHHHDHDHGHHHHHKA